MAEYTEQLRVSKVASGNLDGSQYTFVRQIGNRDVLTIATTGVPMLGVLQNKPQNNEHATVAMLGSTKIRLANSLGVPSWVMAGVSGFAVLAVSGQVVAGQLITGATSGALAEMNFSPFLSATSL